MVYVLAFSFTFISFLAEWNERIDKHEATANSLLA